MSDALSVRQMARLLKRLHISDGDIVLVKENKFNTEELMEALRRGVERLDIGGIYVILVSDFDNIKTLNRQEMMAHGWYHISDINKLTGRVKNG